MLLELHRIARKETYTIGRLYIESVRFCDTLEPRDRYHFGEEKVMGSTAIPTGTYEIDLSTVSPKYAARVFYQRVCGGRVPRLCGVPDFCGVLVHVGNTAKDTAGCILVGKNTAVGRLTDSRNTFAALMYDYLNLCRVSNEKVFISVC